MSRRDFRDDACSGCGEPLDKAFRYRREDVICGPGEYEGEPGVEVTAFCSCGVGTVIFWSASPRAAA